MNESFSQIKAELERINEARAKATEINTCSVDEFEEVLNDHGYFSCSENNRECAEFIALAANEILNLSKALSVAVIALNKANYEIDYYEQKPHKALEVIYSNRDALKSIADILSGGGGGK